MLELPESYSRALELKAVLAKKQIKAVITNHSPHKFAFFHEDHYTYHDLLSLKRINDVTYHGGQIEIFADDMRIVFGDGVNVLYFQSKAEAPLKHQMLIEFIDGSVLICVVQMYGFLWAFPEGKFDNYYYYISKEKPSVLDHDFDEKYFLDLVNPFKDKTLSIKAFLATEQRIPGLGNGVLQDILFNARINPKRKLNTLSQEEVNSLYYAIKSTITDMASKGGRDTETDIYGAKCGYQTILSKNNVNKPCPKCASLIKKESYMGGSVYYCENCQK